MSNKSPLNGQSYAQEFRFKFLVYNALLEKLFDFEKINCRILIWPFQVYQGVFFEKNSLCLDMLIARLNIFCSAWYTDEPLFIQGAYLMIA